jgi:two-component system LytT family response regulator
MKLKTIIVEDEVLGQKALAYILKDFCQETIDLADITGTVDSAVQSIRKLKPQLVFLDIKLGSNSRGAFDILKNLHDIDFSIIFTTSSELPEDILKALNDYGAKKYLLKPLDIDEVIDAVNYVIAELNHEGSKLNIDQIKQIVHEVSQQYNSKKVTVPIRSATELYPCDDIIMLRAGLNNTYLFHTNGSTIKSSKNLKFFEKQIITEGFIRVSRSYIINFTHVHKYSKEDGGTIFLSNGCTAPLSGKYANNFIKILNSNP